MLDHLTTEARNPASERIDTLNARQIAELMNQQDMLVAEAVAAQIKPISDAIELIANKLRGGGRLIYLGAGTSGRLGVLDAAECPPTFSTPPELVLGVIAGGNTALVRAVEGAEDCPSDGRQALAAESLSANDVVVGIASSGRTPYVIGGLQYAREIGAACISLTCNADSPLSEVAEISICPIVGPEIISGSTRLKAGTATKMVLNMLTTGTMVLLGKTYGNRMVDLRATNEKLRQRSIRITRELTGLSEPEAHQLLDRCDGELKTAIVSQRLGMTPSSARERLIKCGQQLREALSESKDVNE